MFHIHITSDIPQTVDTIQYKYANYTAILSSNMDSTNASLAFKHHSNKNWQLVTKIENKNERQQVRT